MDDDRLVDAWLSYAAGCETAEWAMVQLIEECARDPHHALRLIMELIRRSPSEAVTGAIAAGPLEWLISVRGADVIDALEAEVKRVPELASLLSGIYRLNTPISIWKRIVALSGRERQMDDPS
ncbi:MAG TPA: hypothetical protein VF824_19190 [Thermoanaerobaculia bacterium]